MGSQHYAPAVLPPRKDLILIVQEAGWASVAGVDDTENIASTGVRSPDFPARDKSLHTLRHICHIYIIYIIIIHNIQHVFMFC